MGWNTPDDCPWTSDQDYYDAKRGPFEGPDREDETPELINCDNCTFPCEEPHRHMTEGGDLIADFCCLCVLEDAPRSARFEPCRSCAARTKHF